MKKLFLAGIALLVLVLLGVNSLSVFGGGCISDRFFPPMPKSSCETKCEEWLNNGFTTYDACIQQCRDNEFEQLVNPSCTPPMA